MTDELVIEARKGGPCAELGDRCRAIEAASGCFCAAVADRIEDLQAERERLALAICGGEDAPGYANAQTVETLEHVAKQNRQSHGATINSLLAAEAERDRLREALNQSRLAFAGHVSVQSAIDLIDRAALKGESHE